MSTLPAGASPLYVAAIVIALVVIAAVAALWRRRAQPWKPWNKDKAEELAVRHADEFGSKVLSAIKRVISEEIGVSLE